MSISFAGMDFERQRLWIVGEVVGVVLFGQSSEVSVSGLVGHGYNWGQSMNNDERLPDTRKVVKGFRDLFTMWEPVLCTSALASAWRIHCARSVRSPGDR